MSGSRVLRSRKRKQERETTCGSEHVQSSKRIQGGVPHEFSSNKLQSSASGSPGQNLTGESAQSLTNVQASQAREHQILLESLESLKHSNRQLDQEKSDLINKVSRLEEKFQKSNFTLMHRQFQLSNAEDKAKLFQKTAEDLEAGLEKAKTKHAEDISGLEARVTELSESYNKASIEVTRRIEELSNLRAESMEKDKALKRVQETYQDTVDKLAVKNREASKAEAEIVRLRPFELAVTEHNRALTRLEQGRQDFFRQQQEQLNALTAARNETIRQKGDNIGLRRKNDALNRKVRALETATKKTEARVSQFLLFIMDQIWRQIEAHPQEPGHIVKVSADHATLTQLEDWLQKKLDDIEHELQWYKNEHTTMWNESERLEQLRNEMVSQVVRLSTYNTSELRQSWDQSMVERERRS
ncbi:hypothetical protein J7T55_004864 [Diaporthe amygdali]|uniref:uncharacterized protein n=1 Tax=Phomopsis amygdali TaxID=1214568 RepID=UPI0022FE746A|nr:uncharacterized protein J7T55_004864 [Diaporthe amygdali]KAJ0114620.1 hypothetical protein J7T55_004864 [Diaporthe amygdali]